MVAVIVGCFFFNSSQQKHGAKIVFFQHRDTGGPKIPFNFEGVSPQGDGVVNFFHPPTPASGGERVSP